MLGDPYIEPTLKRKHQSTLPGIEPPWSFFQLEHLIPSTPITQDLTSINSNHPSFSHGQLSDPKFKSVTNSSNKAHRPPIESKLVLAEPVCSTKERRISKSKDSSISKDKFHSSIQAFKPNADRSNLFVGETSSDEFDNNTPEKGSQDLDCGHVEATSNLFRSELAHEPPLKDPEPMTIDLEHIPKKPTPSEAPGYVGFRKPVIPLTPRNQDHHSKSLKMETRPWRPEKSSSNIPENLPNTVSRRRGQQPAHTYWDEINKANKRNLNGACQRNIPTYVLLKLNQLAGLQLMKDEEVIMKKYNLYKFYGGLQSKLLTSKVLKSINKSHLRFFVRRLIVRVGEVMTPCFLYLVKQAVELFEELDVVSVFESHQHALETALGYIKGYWKNRFEEYEIRLGDPRYEKVMNGDVPTRREILNLPDQALEETEMGYMDSLTFIRRAYTWSPFIWKIFASWLQTHSPVWYQLYYSRELKLQEPCISKQLKTCIINHAIRRKVITLIKGKECEFQYSPTLSLNWNIRYKVI